MESKKAKVENFRDDAPGNGICLWRGGRFCGDAVVSPQDEKMEIPDSGATVFAVAGGRGILDPEMRRRREMQVFIVALGGALGASARYVLSLLPGKWDFPVWTFLTNICGLLSSVFWRGFWQGKRKRAPGMLRCSGRPDFVEDLRPFPRFLWRRGIFWSRAKC